MTTRRTEHRNRDQRTGLTPTQTRLDANNPGWQKKAKCRHYQPGWMFPLNTDRSRCQICLDCPVRSICAEYGWDENYGIWGGLTARQRHPTGRTN